LSSHHEPDKPAARKKPGRRPSLSRDKILETALDIANDQGLDALTLRRLAQELKVAPMAIYRYFSNKDELLNVMFDYVSSLPDLESCSDENWHEELGCAYAAIKQNLVSHPGILPLLTQRYGVGEMTHKSTERLLQTLSRSGQPDEVRAHTNFALIAYTVGFAVLESAVKHQQQLAGIESEEEWRAIGIERMASLSVDDFPERVKLAPYIADFVSDQQFRYGLDLLVNKLDPVD
jgi:AcrR family transcriptional regulator